MKKYLFLMFILLIMPFSVLGLSINSTSIEGSDFTYTTNKLDLKIKIDFNDYNDVGLAVVMYELKFDDTVFNVYDIMSDTWDTALYKDNNSYYVVSTINQGVNDRCSDGFLYCGNYEINLLLYAKDTDITSSDISIGKIEVGLVNTNYGNKEITNKDVIVVNGNGNITKTINIKQSGISGDTDVSKIKVNNSKPKVNDVKGINDKRTSYIKSSNNYIEDLQIEGYNLKFRGFTNDYRLTVKKGINSLKVNVKLLSDKAKYKIIGNDDLKENNNEVKVEVTAENGNKNIYTIKIDYEKEVDIPVKNTEEEPSNWQNNKLFKYGIIIFGIITILITVLNVILKIKDRTVEKKIKKL